MRSNSSARAVVGFALTGWLCPPARRLLRVARACARVRRARRRAAPAPAQRLALGGRGPRRSRVVAVVDLAGAPRLAAARRLVVDRPQLRRGGSDRPLRSVAR